MNLDSNLTIFKFMSLFILIEQSEMYTNERKICLYAILNEMYHI